jgi:8-oxo-dGTP diphosphatase
MGKSARLPVQAAGGIVLRDGARPLVAVVQRRKDRAWVLPKGKLKRSETPIAAAKREATEETGHDVTVHEFLGVISYVGHRGPKVAHFWRMQATDEPASELMDDIKAVDWLPLKSAVERLSLPHEQSFLRHVGRKALKAARAGAQLAPEAHDKARPVAADDAAAAVEANAPVHAPAVKPRERWHALARLSRNWKAAVGRMWQQR